MDIDFKGKNAKPHHQKPSLSDKIWCWSCGMYQTECGLCDDCVNYNLWTLKKIIENKSKEQSRTTYNRIKPDYLDS